MVLKVPGEELEHNSTCVEKVFAHMGHGILVGGGRNLELLMEFRQLKEHRLGS